MSTRWGTAELGSRVPLWAERRVEGKEGLKKGRG